MYEYIKGTFVEVNPAAVSIENHGLAYHVNISLYTYTKISNLKEGKLFLHLIVREDEHLLFGFIEKEERQLFRLLISVSGVGPNTARLILSSLPPVELITAIGSENVNLIKSVKGVGPKTAQKMVIDLKDKVKNMDIVSEKISFSYNKNSEESLSALVALGFNKNQASDVVKKIVKDDVNIPVEEIIKKALKYL